MSEEKIYNNRPSPQILFKAGTNRHTKGDTKSIVCDWNVEDLKHFLSWCPGYQETRKNTILLQRPYIENEHNITGQLLFNELKIQEAKDIVHEMWQKRESQRKNVMQQQQQHKKTCNNIREAPTQRPSFPTYT